MSKGLFSKSSYEKTFPLYVFDQIDIKNLEWTPILKKYAKNNLQYQEDWKRFRHIEEEVQRIDYYRHLISINLQNPRNYLEKLNIFKGDKRRPLKWILNSIEPLDSYYMKYIAWLRELMKAIPFKDTCLAYLQVPFAIKYPSTGSYTYHEFPEIEILASMYNLAWILFAKGVLLEYKPNGKHLSSFLPYPSKL